MLPKKPQCLINSNTCICTTIYEYGLLNETDDFFSECLDLSTFYLSTLYSTAVVFEVSAREQGSAGVRSSPDP